MKNNIKIKSGEFEITTKGNNHIVNITSDIEEIIKDFSQGILNLFLKSTTSALFINEDERGLLNDFRKFLEKIIPSQESYEHDLAWQEGNGFSHLRSIITGNSLTIPIHNGKPNLGTWQNIFLIDYDINPRTRKIFYTIIGE